MRRAHLESGTSVTQKITTVIKICRTHPGVFRRLEVLAVQRGEPLSFQFGILGDTVELNYPTLAGRLQVSSAQLLSLIVPLAMIVRTTENSAVHS